MRTWARLLKYFSVAEAWQILWALVLNRFGASPNRHALLLLSAFDYVIRRGGTIRRLPGKETEFHFDGIRMWLRDRGSDLMVFDQLFPGKGLEKVIDEAKRKFTTGNIRIMDCGSNIGLSVLIFKASFPDATVLAVEPSKENFARLARNVEGSGVSKVQMVEGGVWSAAGMLSGSNNFRDGKDWSFTLNESNQKGEKTIMVDTIAGMALRAGWQSVDILKIDIEGAEFVLFRNLDAWRPILDAVKIISVEPHDEIGPSSELEQVLRENNFHTSWHQELLIGVRKS